MSPICLTGIMRRELILGVAIGICHPPLIAARELPRQPPPFPTVSHYLTVSRRWGSLSYWRVCGFVVGVFSVPGCHHPELLACYPASALPMDAGYAKTAGYFGYLPHPFHAATWNHRLSKNRYKYNIAYLILSVNKNIKIFIRYILTC